MYIAVVSKHLRLESLEKTYDGLSTYQCYSCWDSRDDITHNALATGPISKKKYPIENAMDGYFCPAVESNMYITSSSRSGLQYKV